MSELKVSNVEVKSLNGGQLAGMRNKIINGAFQVNQRAYVSGAATTAGQYMLDRWKVTGTGGVTFSTTNNKTTVTIPSGQTLQQVIEGLNLQTGTYVLSWEGTAQGRIGGGSYGSSGAVTASITGGTNTTIEFNAGTVANVQLELGTVATPFEHRFYGQELDFCRRYLPCLIASGASTNWAVGVCTNSSTALGTFAVPFNVEARVPPTGITVTAALSNLQVAGNGASTSVNSLTFLSASTSRATIAVSWSGGSIGLGDVCLLNTGPANIRLLFTGCEL